MLIEFHLRQPGNHHKVAEAHMPAVPRIGETVILSDGRCLDVHSVSYDIPRERVIVLLKVS